MEQRGPSADSDSAEELFSTLDDIATIYGKTRSDATLMDYHSTVRGTDVSQYEVHNLEASPVILINRLQVPAPPFWKEVVTNEIDCDEEDCLGRG